MQRMMGLVRRCIEDYRMIEPGDRIAVGVSGGKDSLTLLTLLAALREYVPYSYDLTAITIDMGLGGMDFSPVARLCERLGVPYSRVETEIGPIIFEHRKENNPCSLCAKMRRGALNQALLEQGFSKVALGHHYDDAVETFLMSLLFEGRIGCFEPVTYLDRTGVTQIRPMLYLTEGMVRTFAAEHDLPVVHNLCPADKHTKRQEIKELVAVLSKTYPDLKARVFGAMQRLPLPQWGVTPHPRGSQKQLHQHDGCKAGQAEKADDAGRGRGDGDIEPGQGREQIDKAEQDCAAERVDAQLPEPAQRRGQQPHEQKHGGDGKCNG